MKSNKLALFQSYSVKYLMLSTIGVYQQHDMCGALARHVRSDNKLVKDGHIESLCLL